MDDTISVCNLMAQGQVGVWSKIVYQSKTWRELTAKADEGSREARCKMGKLIEQHKASSRKCTDDMVTHLTSFCGAEDAGDLSQ